MNKNVVIGLGIVIVVLAAWLLMMGGNKTDQDATADVNITSDATSTPNTSGTSDTSPDAGTGTGTGGVNVDVTAGGSVSAPSVKSFTVTGTNFAFAPKEMRVKKGDTVRVTFNNASGVHDWKLDAFNVATKVLQAGKSETVEFVASKTGTFEYYCSVGEHRAMGMRGNLIVE